MDFFKDTRKISFCPIVNVCIIPGKEMYTLYNIKHDIWWTNDEFVSFRQSCLQEIRELIIRNRYITIKQASKLLYQPGNITISYDCENFE